MSGLHGECPPHALQSLLGIPEIDAKKYVSQLIAEGIIKPNPLLQESVSKVLRGKDESVFEKVKKRYEMKAKATSGEVKFSENPSTTRSLDDSVEVDTDALSNNEAVDEETQIQDEAKVESY